MIHPVELDNAYLERVYAGVLGKVIGVYLGRPFEGWTYERIQRELGDIDYYVHDKLDLPLIVTDDDITGTFTFLRALADHGSTLDITAEQIGQSWLNYLIENRTILWWGGLGNSTEHTAYLRLKSGIAAPRSGSRELNSTVVAEQIGAQIFVDGWAMVAPGEPRLAADLARRAGSVSHDGEALHAAAAWAAMEAEAFVNPDTHHLIDTALSVIPQDSTIARLIRDLRQWHAEEADWRATRERIDTVYGYKNYGGNVHVVPNHALMHLGLLYGAGDFSRSLSIVNTAGWDTDCNSGNLGALLGLQLGLAGIDAGADWRGPIADRLYLPSAEGTRAISDAARESIEIANIARATRGEEAISPKNGARFHFTLPGSTQGFTATGDGSIRNQDQTLRLNVNGQLTVTTPTFVPPDYRHLGYELIASPTLHSGQTVTACLTTPAATRDEALAAEVAVAVYGSNDEMEFLYGPRAEIGTSDRRISFTIPDTGGQPVAAVGIRVSGEGTVGLDSLDWSGTPSTAWIRPASGRKWASAWVDAVDHFQTRWPEDSFRLIQNSGTGIVSTGGPWRDLRLEAAITPHFATRAGIAVRVMGNHRYAALEITASHTARLVVREHETTQVLSEIPITWELGRAYELVLEPRGQWLGGWVDGDAIGPALLPERSAASGAIALLVTDGRMATNEVRVSPAETTID